MSMMKSTLTADDAPGWYECCERRAPSLRGTRYLVVWPPTADGPGTVALTDMVPNGQCQEFTSVDKFTDFVRLVPAIDVEPKANSIDRQLAAEVDRAFGLGPILTLAHDHDEARALHRIVRAMHDGECPKCHKLYSSEDMVHWKGDVSYHKCPSCGFAISNDESTAALAEFATFMEQNLAVFEVWRERRKTGAP